MWKFGAFTKPYLSMDFLLDLFGSSDVVICWAFFVDGRSIQTLLRGENDSKQSDEFQANERVYAWN